MARAGKVRAQTPKVEKQEKKKGKVGESKIIVKPNNRLPLNGKARKCGKTVVEGGTAPRTKSVVENYNLHKLSNNLSSVSLFNDAFSVFSSYSTVFREPIE